MNIGSFIISQAAQKRKRQIAVHRKICLYKNMNS